MTISHYYKCDFCGEKKYITTIDEAKRVKNCPKCGNMYAQFNLIEEISLDLILYKKINNKKKTKIINTKTRNNNHNIYDGNTKLNETENKTLLYLLIPVFTGGLVYSFSYYGLIKNDFLTDGLYWIMHFMTGTVFYYTYSYVIDRNEEKIPYLLCITIYPFILEIFGGALFMILIHPLFKSIIAIF